MVAAISVSGASGYMREHISGLISGVKAVAAEITMQIGG
jgi:hypothetical protein